MGARTTLRLADCPLARFATGYRLSAIGYRLSARPAIEHHLDRPMVTALETEAHRFTPVGERNGVGDEIAEGEVGAGGEETHRHIEGVRSLVRGFFTVDIAPGDLEFA